MMNKPMMGQQPAPSGPPSLNFQSDPGMRSQFKGFMSGMAARNMPAPMPQPAMTMPAIPQQMSSVDIFQPVMGFARGGGVPGDRSGGMGGYGGEARGSQFSGGVRESGPSFSYSADQIAFSDDGDNLSPNLNQIVAAADNRPAITRLYDQGIAALQNLFRNDAQADQLTAADANMGTQAGGDALSNLVARNLQTQNAIQQMRNADQQAAANQQIQSVIADAVAGADTNLLDADIFAAEDADRLAQRQAAEEITRRGGVVNVDPVTGEVTAQVTGPASRPTGPQFDNLGAMGEGFPSSIPTPAPRPSTLIDFDDPTQVPRQAPSAPSRAPVDTVFDIDTSFTAPYEIDTVSPRPQTEVESVMDRAARKDEVPVGFVPGLQNLQQRAESQVFDTSQMAPGIGAALAGLANKIGQGVSGKVLEKVQAGGTPVYGPGGMIVGVYDQSGPFGSTVYTGRPGYDNPELARRISLQPGNESTLPEGMRTEMRKITDPQEDDGAFSFLKFLGMKDGGEVPGFFRGGDVPGDREGTQGSGGAISGGVRDSGGATSYSADEISFGGDDSGDSGTQTIMATPTPQAETQTITATPTPQAQVTPDVVAPQQQVTQPVVSQQMSPRARVAAVEATAKPSFGELAMDLLDVGDLLSSYQDAGMSVQPTVSPGAASVLGYQGPVGTTSVPVAAQYESIVPQAAGIQQGVQGLQNVSTQRQSSGFSLPSIPSLSEIGQAIMGTRPTYDNLTRAR